MSNEIVRLLTDVEKMRKLLADQYEFTTKIPVGTVVSLVSHVETFGTTNEGHYYEDPMNKYVLVDNINNEGENHWGLWPVEFIAPIKL